MAPRWALDVSSPGGSHPALREDGKSSWRREGKRGLSGAHESMASEKSLENVPKTGHLVSDGRLLAAR